MRALDVIIPVKNRAIAPCLQSLRRSLMDWELGTYQLLICDGGSTQPDVVAILESWSAAASVTVWSRPDPGFNKAALINWGLRHSEAETILVSDADILWTSPAIAALLSALAETPTALCPIAQVQETDPQASALARPRYGYHVYPSPQGMTVGVERVDPTEGRPRDRPGCGLVAARRQTWWQLGGYKEQFQGWGWEDQDLLMRAELLGIPLRAVGCVTHQSHPDALRNRFHGDQLPQHTRDRNLQRCLEGLRRGELWGDLTRGPHPPPPTIQVEWPAHLSPGTR